MADEQQATETVEEASETQAETVEQETQEEFDAERAMATIKKLRQFEKEAKALEKENAALKAAEQKRKEAEMSEIDRLKAQNERTEAELERLRTNDTKRRIASEVGLPDLLALRIQGEDEDAMKTDAKKLLEAMPKAVKIKETGGNPGSGLIVKETDEERRRRLFG